MKKLTWKPILSNLRAALGEIDGTYLRLYFQDLGELPSDCPRSGDASYIATGCHNMWRKKMKL